MDFGLFKPQANVEVSGGPPALQSWRVVGGDPNVGGSYVNDPVGTRAYQVDGKRAWVKLSTGVWVEDVAVNVGGAVDVRAFGAIGDGAPSSTAADTAAFKAALAAARGGALGVGRTVFRLYCPTVPGGFYRINEELVIDGTLGLVIFGDGAYSSSGQATITWCGPTGGALFRVLGSAGGGARSTPNCNVTFSDLTLHGCETAFVDGGAVPANVALAGIYVGALSGDAVPTLQRSLNLQRVTISYCRFGVWSGSPSALNTDHALVTIQDCRIEHNHEGGVRVGDSNTLCSLSDSMVASNGWSPAAADAYGDGRGTNVRLWAGYLDVRTLVSGGHPLSAGIWQDNGRVDIDCAWSEDVGFFYYQAGVSPAGTGYQSGKVSGVRHYGGPITSVNTPDSMRIIAPGTVVQACQLTGNIQCDSGVGGRPVFSGIQFLVADRGFTGTGVHVQRSLVVIGNRTNFGQVAVGGTNAGVAMSQKGQPAVGLLVRGDNPAVFQALDASDSGNGVTLYCRTDNASGVAELCVNCVRKDAAGTLYTPISGTAPAWRILFGGGYGVRLRVADPNGSTADIGYAAFADIGGWLVPNADGFRTQGIFIPPARDAAPTYSSGDVWKGGLFFRTGDSKLMLNTGGSTWVVLNP